MSNFKLREVIKQIRQCKTAAEERAVISKESALIRNAFKVRSFDQLMIIPICRKKIVNTGIETLLNCFFSTCWDILLISVKLNVSSWWPQAISQRKGLDILVFPS